MKTIVHEFFVGPFAQHGFFVRKSNGHLYGFGYNDYRQVGVNNWNNYYENPQLISQFSRENRRIRKVAVGTSHSIFITENGEVFSCGRNEEGLKSKVKVPTKLGKDSLEACRNKIIDCECGAWSSFIVSSTRREIFGFGENLKYHNNAIRTPTLITLPFKNKSSKVIQVAAGSLFVLYLTNDRMIFGNGQVGKIDTKGYPMLLHRADSKNPIVKIISTEKSAFFLREFGQVLGVGQEMKGFMKNNVHRENIKEIHELEGVKGKDIACGSQHFIFSSTSTNKNIGIYGWGEWGQLGVINKKIVSSYVFDDDDVKESLSTKRFLSFEEINGKVCEVYGGRANTYAFTENGEFYGCGANDLGQLLNCTNFKRNGWIKLFIRLNKANVHQNWEVSRRKVYNGGLKVDQRNRLLFIVEVNGSVLGCRILVDKFSAM